MKKLLIRLLAVVMLCGVSAGAFAQKRDDGKRPVKQPVKVVTPDKKDPPRTPEKPKDNKKKP